ncbi:MAG TPA: hypothetical protein VFM42_02825, partial [Sphingomicrobium sp.]|nr:hypothetical protein [Sphingomicrobium sp.]
MRMTILAALGAFLGLFAAPAEAQAPKPLFATSEPLRITIQAPLPGLIRNRASPDVVSGTLTGADGIALPVTLSLRGITRRSRDTCDFPPLRV